MVQLPGGTQGSHAANMSKTASGSGKCLGRYAEGPVRVQAIKSAYGLSVTRNVVW